MTSYSLTNTMIQLLPIFGKIVAKTQGVPVLWNTVYTCKTIRNHLLHGTTCISTRYTGVAESRDVYWHVSGSLLRSNRLILPRLAYV